MRRGEGGGPAITGPSGGSAAEGGMVAQSVQVV
jgi:hypothetical protein